MVVILDSSAWIEFFLGTDKGLKVKELVAQGGATTSIITFAEIVHWCHKSNQAERIAERVGGIKNGSEIINLNEEILTIAGRISYERKKITQKWGMMDSIILATARIYGLKVVTKDQDFRGLENVEII